MGRSGARQHPPAPPRTRGQTSMTASPAFDHDSFVHRHVGTDASAQRHMLDTLGLESVDELIERAVPSTVLLEPDTEPAVPPGISETAALEELRTLAQRNKIRNPPTVTCYSGTQT